MEVGRLFRPPVAIEGGLAHVLDAVGDRADVRRLGRAGADARYCDGAGPSAAAMRLPADVVERYFEPLGDGTWRIIQDLRESVKFTVTNVIDPASVAAQGRFDVVFCRNVLIYFDDSSRLRAVDNLYAAVNPGGYVCLGHTESMSRISKRFELRRFEDAIVYQRPGEERHG